MMLDNGGLTKSSVRIWSRIDRRTGGRYIFPSSASLQNTSNEQNDGRHQ